MLVTTNGAKSYHEHVNAECNAPHPNITYLSRVFYVNQHAATYVTVSSVSSFSKSRTIPRSKREKSACFLRKFLQSIQLSPE